MLGGTTMTGAAQLPPDSVATTGVAPETFGVNSEPTATQFPFDEHDTPRRRSRAPAGTLSVVGADHTPPASDAGALERLLGASTAGSTEVQEDAVTQERSAPPFGRPIQALPGPAGNESATGKPGSALAGTPPITRQSSVANAMTRAEKRFDLINETPAHALSMTATQACRLSMVLAKPTSCFPMHACDPHERS
jgi:hypothetical protein